MPLRADMAFRGPVSSNAERTARCRGKRFAAGLVQLNIVVPAAAVDDLRIAASRLRDDPDLTVDRLTSRRTGRLISVRRGRL